MNLKITLIALSIFLILVLGACGPQTTIGVSQNPNFEVFEVSDDNFQVKTYINKLQFQEREEINMYSTIEYIGEKNQISIWSGDPYFHHIINNGEEYFNEDMTRELLMETIFRRGEVYTIPFIKSGAFSEDDPKADFWKKHFVEKELKLPKGNYTFTAGTAFSLDQGQVEGVTLKTEFKVIVN